MDITEEQLAYDIQCTCKRNPVYPIVRYLCGEVHRILDSESVPERFSQGTWQPHADMK